MWTVLYIMMGIAAWLVWSAEEARARRKALLLFVVQLVLNALWSWLFFYWHRGAWAMLNIVLLWISLASTLAMFWKVGRLAGMLLVPYLAWVGFASALNLVIWQANPLLR